MELRDFLLLVWRQKNKLIGIPLIAVLIFTGMTWLVPPKYEAQGSFMIRGSGYTAWLPGQDRNAIEQEYAKSGISLIYTDSFLREVIKNLSLPTDTKTLSDNIRFDNLEGTNIIRLKIAAYNPEMAAHAVNGTIDLLHTKITQSFLPREMTILERATVPTDPHRSFLFCLALTLVISFMWVLSTIMFIANRGWRD